VTTNANGHESYLLRLWRAQGERPWRAWVQCATGDEVLRFTSPEALCAYLASDIPAVDGGPAPGRRGPDSPEEIR
jgi:hypothetical protein